MHQGQQDMRQSQDVTWMIGGGSGNLFQPTCLHKVPSGSTQPSQHFQFQIQGHTACDPSGSLELVQVCIPNVSSKDIQTIQGSVRERDLDAISTPT
jgi:hypothetical protein